jgi:hypothetical protein
MGRGTLPIVGLTIGQGNYPRTLNATGARQAMVGSSSH